MEDVKQHKIGRTKANQPSLIDGRIDREAPTTKHKQRADILPVLGIFNIALIDSSSAKLLAIE